MHKTSILLTIFLLAASFSFTSCNKWDYEEGRYLLENDSLVLLEHYTISGNDFYIHWGKNVTPEQQNVIRELINSFVMIKGNTFMMGAQSTNASDDNYDEQAAADESPVHKVTLSDYFLCKHEITQKEWSTIMNQPNRWANDNWSNTTACPANGISYEEACQFISTLQSMTGLSFRLPTEAEWEFAARGGNPNKMNLYSYGSVWTYENTNYTLHTASGLPNELGIFNMCGNVAEWCSDLYGEYSPSPQTNPSGSSAGEEHVLKGGSFCYLRIHCRCTSRDYFNSTYPATGNGFRLAMSNDN